MSRRRRDDSEPAGVLLVDKPAGPTSHDVVGFVRWALGVRRVGHCGTLDPAATGLLVVGVGAATKLVPYLTGQDKGYRAVFSLGRRTTTGDAQGEVLDRRPCPPGLEERVPPALAALRGTLELPPPAFSAIHVDGKRAHELARAGELTELPARPMTVLRMEPGPVTRESDRVEVQVTLLVSKGTYVRSLAEALGQRLGVPAHLAALHRLSSGALSLSDPRALGPLRACPREPGPQGIARWRIEGPAELGSEREALGAWLRAHLLDPALAVPLPLLRADPGEGGQRALRCLSSGRPVPLHDPGLHGTAGDAERVAIAPAEPGEPGLVVARVTGEGLDARLEPERVVVPPALRP
ncbi:MAG: tRNA pseudouridine(55) synthase TruB [Myxococcales bacterium]|nr:tRNA pseudouridine(55) synthase TruB [Myxococcales bacterium]